LAFYVGCGRILPCAHSRFRLTTARVDLCREVTIAFMYCQGPSAYVLKTCAASELLVALRAVLRGGTYLSPTISKETGGFLVRQNKTLVEEGSRLTDRQREVLQLLAEGKSMKEAAAILSGATRTVAFHKYRMMDQQTANQRGLFQYAMRLHLVAA
jgi:DNA-binding NarL/FixJ family response regulator